MSYSIFNKTMVDMSYKMIEQLADKNAPVLLPISVVEEHGPHLCTGVDIYLTQSVCNKICDQLQKNNIDALIAPPFYWGINSITNGFIGSFQISPQTTKQLLYEIIKNFENWGFTTIFLLSFHGDYQHMRTIAEVTQDINSQLRIKTSYVAAKNLFTQLGFNKRPSCFLPVNLASNQLSIEADHFDFHAGADETSWMLLEYPDLVDINIAKTLPSTKANFADIKKWLLGGEAAKEITPNGYLGNPANINVDAIKSIEKQIVYAYTNCIKNMLN